MTGPDRVPETLRGYYDTCLAAHGDNARGAGWPNETDRQMRFSIMRHLAHAGAMDDVCDVACGTGAFLEHLTAAGARPRRYVGVDISPAAIAAARAKHGSETFLVHDIEQASVPAGPPFDYVVANGLFTVRATIPEAQMWKFMESAVANMWKMARIGIAFNVMSDVVDWRREDLFHVPGDALLEMLYSMAGRRVILRADYDLYEYTAYVFRQPPGARMA